MATPAFHPVKPFAARRSSTSLDPEPTAQTDPHRKFDTTSPGAETGHSRSFARRSFDDLVGAMEDRLWECQAERLGGLQIDDQLERRRLLDWQIGGLGALEDFSDVGA